MLISPAYAQGAGGGGAGFDALLPFVLIALIFYFLLLRPQQKQRKAHREMLENLRRGDQVVTGGGIIGKISKINSETEVTVEIADNVKVAVARGTIAALVNPPDNQPAKGGAGKEAKQEGAAADQPKSLLSGLFGGRK